MTSRSKQNEFSGQRSTARSHLLRSVLLLVLVACLVAACGNDGSEKPLAKTISLPEDVLRDRSVLDVLREDTDGDDRKEWVVFYRFDRVNDTGPVAALIYDVVVDFDSDLPLVYPYKLRIP